MASDLADEAFLASTVEEYVASRGGNLPIKRILVANNGLAAVKAMRSVRDFAYQTFGDEHAVQFVAMATPEDIAANAVYVGIADEVYNVPGGTNNHNFANVELIVDIAKRMAVDAVMVGWGHASENPRLADALREAGVEFVGPPASAMRALGDKIASTIVAQSAAVPTMPWSGDGLTIDSACATVPDDVFKRACITSAAAAADCAARIGYPVMIKASEGGGGKGIRKVLAPEDMETAFRQVASEVPGSPIFVMKLAPNARHLEVQVLADKHGNAIALFGRDCSMQRRHQKIIEEGPVTVATVEAQAAMEQAAIRLAKQVGYVSAGTVEYLYFDGQFFILELNTRLQVEHPVTEMITGVNIPAVQVQIAMGMPLTAIPDIRRFYGQPLDSTAPFDLSVRMRPQGHTIAVRITAENPDEGFKPTSGAISELSFQSTPAVWAYFSARSGSSLHEFSDSQFGHLFAKAETREAARRAMVRALHNVSIRGDIRHPVEYLIGLLESADFRGNTFSTAWLDERIRQGMLAKTVDLVGVVCGALARAYRKCVDRLGEFAAALERGQILPSAALTGPVEVSLLFANIKYAFSVYQSGANSYTLLGAAGAAVEAEVVPLRDGSLLIYLDGKTHTAFAREEVSGLRLVLDSKTIVFSDEFDPSLIRASTPGKIVRLLVPEGSHVAAGAPIAEIEAMKMIMSLASPAAGIVSFLKAEGSVLAPGVVIANLLLDNAAAVTRATPFAGSLPAFKPPRARGDRSHQRLELALGLLGSVLAGFENEPALLTAQVRDAVAALAGALADPQLPSGELAELLSSLSSRLPRAVAFELQAMLEAYVKAASSAAGLAARTEAAKAAAAAATGAGGAGAASSAVPSGSAAAAPSVSAPVFPVEAMFAVLDSHEASLPESARGSFRSLVAPIASLLTRFTGGRCGYGVALVTGLLRQYVAVEAAFSSDKRRHEDVLWDLRDGLKSDLSSVLAAARSHAALKAKNEVVRGLLAGIEDGSLGATGDYGDCLRELASLSAKIHARVALRARRLLIHASLPSVAIRLASIESELAAIARIADEAAASRALQALVTQPQCHSDVLLAFLRSRSTDIQRLAARAYLLRTYTEYDLLPGIEARALSDGAGPLLVSFLFKLPARGIRTSTVARAIASSTSFSNLARLAETSAAAAAAVAAAADASDSGSASPAAGTLSPARMARGSGGGGGSGGLSGTVSPAVPADGGDGADSRPERYGGLLVVSSLAELEAHWDAFLRAYQPPAALGPKSLELSQFVNTLNVMVALPLEVADAAEPSDETLRASFQAFLAAREAALLSKGIRRITLGLVRRTPQASPALSTFRATLGYQEDLIHRNIEPPLAFQLEIARLSRFDIAFVPCEAPHLHVFFATARGAGARWDRRIFVRAIVRDAQTAGQSSTASAIAFLETESERYVVDALDALELLSGDARFANTDSNHIFLNFIPEVTASVAFVQGIVMRFVALHGRRMFQLRCMSTELRLQLRQSADVPPAPVRVVVSSNSGFVVRFEAYLEAMGEDGVARLVTLVTDAPSGKGPLDGTEIATPYEHADPVAKRRVAAHALDTSFVYDFPELFRLAVQERWMQADAAARKAGSSLAMPQTVLEATELVLPAVGSEADAAQALVPVSRPDGANDIGMVAWSLQLFTPEYPPATGGQTVILIANDVTFKMGSFGPLEDELFYRASRLARAHGHPRFYVSANSGARIGLADEVKAKFRVAFTDPARPDRGVAYLYLTPADAAELAASVHTVPVTAADGAVHHRLVDIIGLADDLGVENLRGSGLIAGETSVAYEDVFTVSMVTARSVGIGAYLVRLGQRVVQHKSPPILLTGAGALNKLLGQDVYSSNSQLGGIKIMHANGVSHLVGENNLACVQEMVHWLSYVPRARGARLPAVVPHDPVDRDIAFEPPSTPYDPRRLLTGVVSRGGWVSGLLDEGSFKETLGGWARTVVVGRGRLGGIPLGVIAVETRTVDTIVPADPANKASSEFVQLEAGQVLFPNSAFKTAQAIADFNNGEQLPLLILSNWRGFSGGMRDMFYEVLKYGSFIVDALRKFRQPIMMYIPPGGELRGGAWVVVDPQINREHIQMFADVTARGSILEPEGTVEIKFKGADLVAAMHRTDSVLVAADAELAAAAAGARAAIQAAIAEREALLAPVYHQIAIQFCELHDTPGRMKAKGVISDIVEWRNARRFFHARLRRRMEVHYVARALEAAVDGMGYGAATDLVGQWAGEAGVAWDSDGAVADWLVRDAGAVAARVATAATEAAASKVAAVETAALAAGVRRHLAGLSADARAAFLRSLQ